MPICCDVALPLPPAPAPPCPPLVSQCELLPSADPVARFSSVSTHAPSCRRLQPIVSWCSRKRLKTSKAAVNSLALMQSGYMAAVTLWCCSVLQQRRPACPSTTARRPRTGWSLRACSCPWRSSKPATAGGGGCAVPAKSQLAPSSATMSASCSRTAKR